MKIIRELLLLIILTLVLTSCDNASPTHSSNSPSLASVSPNEALSPFVQYGSLKKGEVGYDGEQVDNILRSYGIYDEVLAKVPKELYNDSICSDVRINGYTIGNKKIALLLINKGHLYIYVMLSNNNDKWIVDGFTYQSERDKPEYRIEQSGNNTKYWLVAKHEANHGTGLQIYNEIWYNPDGSVAAEYPLGGSMAFFPENVEPQANAYFSSFPYFDGDSKISLSYSISFAYGYKDNFQSQYSPVIRENWEYDLKTQQLNFISCESVLPEGSSPINHVLSADYGILQGYIDFYRTRLGDKKITTLGEWEQFIDLK